MIHHFHEPFILNLLREPVFSEPASDSGTHSYRFCWARTWFETRLLRINIESNQKGSIIVKGFQFQPRNGQIEVHWLQNDIFSLSAEEIAVWLNTIEYNRFWEIARGQLNRSGMDGSIWIIEGLKDGQYHEIYRWSPSEQIIHNLGLTFLKLGRLQIDKDTFF